MIRLDYSAYPNAFAVWGRMMSLSESRRFDLKQLFAMMFIASVAAAMTRFLIVLPDLLGPVLVVGFFIAVILTPTAVRRFKRVETRLGVGCVLLPMLYLIAAMIASFSVFYLQQRFQE